jgi:2-keto-4-pentenoate hydratase/2-oxohepta-3-ene-1,7-dioic acid hydratase in catechol pathway
MSVSQSTHIASYQHTDEHGQTIRLPLGKVVCVGRNYMDHIQEMSNQVSDTPLLFMKPSTALVDMRELLAIPTNQGPCHNELEVALLIGTKMTKVDSEQASKGVCGIGLGLDLTLRDEQQRLKQLGQPWERAKAFDGSCPLSPFVMLNSLSKQEYFTFQLHINERLVQNGNTALMLTPMLQLIAEISHFFTLLPGDVILTGTPKGVGPMHVDDKITAVLEGHLSISTRVISQ